MEPECCSEESYVSLNITWVILKFANEHRGKINLRNKYVY
jgi:hypothetical protein